MVFDQTHKLIFIHVPKTAGTSLERFLGLFNKLQNGYGVVNGKAQQHLTLRQYQSKFGSTFNDYFVFTVVRHPYLRFMSDYNMLKRILRISSVEKFLELVTRVVREKSYHKNLYYDHFMPQVDYLQNQNDTLDSVHHIGRFENLQKSINILKAKFPHLSKKNFPIKNPKSKCQLNDRQKKIIFNLYQKDFEKFGYSKDL